VDLTAAAAFVAAGLSLVNVGITARLARRGQREQWRRAEERPLVARCLTLSEDISKEWWDASVAKQDADPDTNSFSMDPHWKKGFGLWRDLRYEVNQLDLLASSSVRQAARDLVEAHAKERSRLLNRLPGQDDFEDRYKAHLKFEELQDALGERTRIDLGLAPRMRVQPRSLLGMLLAAGMEREDAAPPRSLLGKLLAGNRPYR
jgi:hypothetical protein